MRKYKEQFERVNRWYNRFKKINSGKEHNRNTEYDKDDVYIFFVNCHHLKDWIIHDESIREDIEDKVIEFIKEDELDLCREICNAVKHLNEKPKFSKSETKLKLPEKEIKINYTIETENGDEDAFELATKCMEKWEEFIKKEIK